MNAPHEFVYFTDRDLGHQFPATLKAAGIPVEQHDDHFGQLTADPEWLAEIGRRNWVAISRDARIRYSPLALETLMDAGVRLFVIVGRLTTDEAAELFIRHRGLIEELLSKESGAFIGKVKRDRVEVWLRRSEWRRKARPQPKQAGSIRRATSRKVPDALLKDFVGFIPLREVKVRIDDIPACHGVYAVIRSSRAPPRMAEKSGAGWFKGQDPSYPLPLLQGKWVADADVIYIGKAGPTARRTLRRRIKELIEFGSGKEVAHRGGRAIWQLEDIWDAKIAWRIAARDPRRAEIELLRRFEERSGRLPFGNFKR